MPGTRELWSLLVQMGEADKLHPGSLDRSVNDGTWKEIVTGAHLMNPGPPRNGWMEMSINLLSLTSMMSFLTNRDYHPEANVETEQR